MRMSVIFGGTCKQLVAHNSSVLSSRKLVHLIFFFTVLLSSNSCSGIMGSFMEVAETGWVQNKRCVSIRGGGQNPSPCKVEQVPLQATKMQNAGDIRKKLVELETRISDPLWAEVIRMLPSLVSAGLRLPNTVDGHVVTRFFLSAR